MVQESNLVLSAVFKTVSSRIYQIVRRPEKYCNVWSAIIFSVTYAIRLVFIFESSAIAAIKIPTPGMDVDLFWQAARLINQGVSVNQPYFELMMCSSALYSYWLAFWQMILGQDMLPHRLVNAFLVSFSAVLIFNLIRKLTSRFWVAVFWCIIWAALPSLIFFDTTLYKASLALLILSVLLTVVLYEPRTTRIYSYILKGMITGILLTAILSLQIATFLFIAVVFVFFCVDCRINLKEKIVLLAFTTGCFALLILGFNFRNQLLNFRYPWFLPQKGVHFRIGFNEQADGSYVRLKQIDAWPHGHMFQSRLVAEVATRRPLTPAEADRYYIKQALKYIKEHPAHAARLIFKKTILFFNNYEVKGVDDLYYLKSQSRVLSLFPLGLGMIVLFAGLGFCYLLETKHYRMLVLLGGLLGAVLVSNLIIFVSWRYRLLGLVPLILLASYGSVSIQEKIRGLFNETESIRNKANQLICFALLPILIAGIVAYYPAIGGKKRQLYRNAGINERLSRAAEKMHKRLNDKELKAPRHETALIEKAILLKLLHRHSEAFAMFKSICDQSLSDPKAIYHYLVYLMWLGEYQQAIALLNKVKSEDPHLIPQVKYYLKGIEKEAFKIFIERVVNHSKPSSGE